MKLLLFNKPYQVLCQFTDSQRTDSPDHGRKNLADFITLPGYYAAGRLDYLSEGLLILTNNGALQHRITDPANKMQKSYWVQVEGKLPSSAVTALRNGVTLKDGKTLPAKLEIIDTPSLWDRNPPVTAHRNRNSQWLNISIHEGKNRQIRRMLAHVGHPVLRLVRHQIGPWSIGNLNPGEQFIDSVNLPKTNNKSQYQSRSRRATKPTSGSNRSKLKT